jgi:hypothetical protein
MPFPKSARPDALQRVIEELTNRIAKLEASVITSVNGKKPDKIGTVSLGLEELSDVQITSKNPGDLVVWNDGIQAYVAQAPV